MAKGDFKVLCRQELNQKQTLLLAKRIREDYRVHLIMDNLPVSRRENGRGGWELTGCPTSQGGTWRGGKGGAWGDRVDRHSACMEAAQTRGEQEQDRRP
jgi:hypothetical protein